MVTRNPPDGTGARNSSRTATRPAPVTATLPVTAIERLAGRHRGQRVAAFTHGRVIGQALALAAGSRPFAFTGAGNASISRLVITPERWIIRGRAARGLPQPARPRDRQQD